MIDKEALETLFRSHYREMYRLAMTLLHDEAESKDVVAEVFARMAEAGRTEGAGYLLAAVRNRSIQQRIQRLYLLEQEVEAKSAEQLCEESRLLKQGIGQLEPPVCEQVVRLHCEQGMTFREIALQLGTSETTVYKYLRRAMNQLRQHLNKES